MQRAFAVLRSLEGREAPVLIQGESGTGKELAARALHARSPRAQGPFVAVNCGALPEHLIASELFGHVRGAFTGADADRAGLVEAASGGTLFLDEVAELPLSAQATLLRVLQEGEVRRIGEARATSVDVRVLSATHRDLVAMQRAGSFREDLYYRLAVFRLELPPLRERPEDLPALCAHLLARLRERQPVGELSPGALTALRQRSWRGNVRELANVLERAAALAGGGSIEAEHLGPPADEVPLERGPDPLFGLPLKEARQAFSERYARHVLAEEGSIAAAARRAGASRQTLYRLLEERPASGQGDVPSADT